MRTIAGNGSGNPTPPLPETRSNGTTVVQTDDFKDIFSLTPRGLYSLGTSRYYRPEQIILHNTLSMQSTVNPAEAAMIYVIETTDGVKGTLTQPMSGNDPAVTRFFQEAEHIRQQMAHYSRNDC